jgi:hypothetical protein
MVAGGHTMGDVIYLIARCHGLALELGHSLGLGTAGRALECKPNHYRIRNTLRRSGACRTSTPGYSALLDSLRRDPGHDPLAERPHAAMPTHRNHTDEDDWGSKPSRTSYRAS